MHCEDEALTDSAETFLRAEERADGSVIADWRNRDAEVIAVATAALLVRKTRARATAAHVSHPEVASYLQTERIHGAAINAEACPQCFLLRKAEALSLDSLR
jgi:dihydroorotase-like cyclic amidohydrolase